MCSQPGRPELHFTASQMGLALQNQGLYLSRVVGGGALTEQQELGERMDPVFAPMYPACTCCILLLVRQPQISLPQLCSTLNKGFPIQSFQSLCMEPSLASSQRGVSCILLQGLCQPKSNQRGRLLPVLPITSCPHNALRKWGWIFQQLPPVWPLILYSQVQKEIDQHLRSQSLL